MQQSYIKDFRDNQDQTVLIKGWVYNLRSSGAIAFLQVRDGSGFAQAVAVKDQLSSEIWVQVEKLTLESSVEIQGKVTKHPK